MSIRCVNDKRTKYSNSRKYPILTALKLQIIILKIIATMLFL